MGSRYYRAGALLMLATGVSLLSPSESSLVGAQTASKPTPPAKAAAQTATPTQPAGDGGWPRSYQTASGGHITMYQPQIASWANQKQIVAFAAVAYQPKGAPTTEKPALGSVKLEADTSVSLEERLVNLTRVRISESNFSTLPREQTQEVVAQIAKAIPGPELVIGLDRVLANVDKSQILPKNVEGIKSDPPAISFSKTPAILVNIDGEPIWSPIKGNDLKYAVNTNWDLFEHADEDVFPAQQRQLVESD